MFTTNFDTPQPLFKKSKVQRALKVLTVIILLLATRFPASAQYKQLPVIPDKTYDVSTMGAVADGKTLNTSIIQKALDQAADGGGKVLIPKGVYLSGPLTIHSKTELIISEGAVLRLINDIDNYPVINTNHYANFLEIVDGADVKISGKGTIDGQGRIWWEKYDAKALTYRRPQMLFAGNPARIEISGVTFLDPPNTHISIKDGSDVYIHDIRIIAPEHSHNTDGINISARNCTIDKCDIQTGDDNIAINFGGKAGAQPECEDILVTNCHFGYGHGLSVGSYTSGGLHNLKVSDCNFDGTLCGVRIKTARGRGGIVDGLEYSNLTMRNVRAPFSISEYYPHEPKNPIEDNATLPGDRNPVYRNMTFRNIQAFGADQAVIIWGIPESPIENLHFEKVSVGAKTGLQINNATKITFDKCSFVVQKGEMLQSFRGEVSGL